MAKNKSEVEVYAEKESLKFCVVMKHEGVIASAQDENYDEIADGPLQDIRDRYRIPQEVPDSLVLQALASVAERLER